MPIAKRQIVYLNGPPHSGKDEIAKVMALRYNFVHLKFADIIKDIACVTLGLNRKQVEELKDRKHPILGITLREYLIWLSENCFKPKFGNDIFGKFSLTRILQTPSIRIIFSDSGFFDEFRAIAYANYAGDNIVIEVHRPGHDFSKDSRGYWYGPNESDARRFARKHVVHNDGSLRMLRAKGSYAICKELNIPWDEQWTPLE